MERQCLFVLKLVKLSRRISGSLCIAFSVALTVWPAILSAESIKLNELYRFEAHLPLSLEYSTATCSLWTAGNSRAIHRVTLGGSRVETRSANKHVSSAALYQGDLLGITRSGTIVEISKERSATWGGIVSNNTSYMSRLSSGDVRPNGEWIASFSLAPELLLYQNNRNGKVVARMSSPGVFSGLAYDATFGRTYALFRSGNRDSLIVFNERFEIYASKTLEFSTAAAEGIAVQPETGDLFISFREESSVYGEIVRLSIEGLDSDEDRLKRPGPECSVS